MRKAAICFLKPFVVRLAYALPAGSLGTMPAHLNNLQRRSCLYVCWSVAVISLNSHMSVIHLSALCFSPWHLGWRWRATRWEGGASEENGCRMGEGGGAAAAAAFIFSASHVIFIVNKTHLALLSEQGLAREASFHREGEEERSWRNEGWRVQ